MTTLPETMRAIVFKSAEKEATERNLKVDSGIPRPVPKPNEVLIKVRAFGLNYADISGRKGQYDAAPPFPYVAGYEASGVIVEIGDEAKEKSSFQVGQRVLALTSFGGYAEYVVAPYTGTRELPAKMSFAQGAAIPVCFCTAYHCIFETGPFYPGIRVLVHAAAGGVGLASVQMAKSRGAVVFGTASRPEKLELLKDKYNVDHPINYRQNDWAAEIMRITNGEGVDLILDSLGGSSLKKGLEVLRAGGRVVGFGAAALSDRSFFKIPSLLSQVASMRTMNSIDMMINSKGFYGVNMKALGDHRPDLIERDFVAVLKMFEDGEVESILTREENWNDIAKAHRDIESRMTTGKTVLIIPDESEDESETTAAV